MRLTSLIPAAIAFFVMACGRSGIDLPADSTAGTSGAAGSIGGGGTTGRAGATGGGGAGGAVDMSGPFCGGHRCAAAQICCVLNGTCVDPNAAATACPAPTTLPPGARACGSNADCTANEFCEVTVGCLGPGTCVERANCGTSTGTPFCGCDGVTYPNVQTACAKGIKAWSPGACGTVSTPGDADHDPMIFCGTDAQCPKGQSCCPISGRCLDAALPALCAPPPAGSLQACLTDRQCFAVSEFCQGPGCSGPGGCVPVSSGACTGVFDPVCGCDGKTYTSEGCTLGAGVRTSHQGGCLTP